MKHVVILDIGKTHIKLHLKNSLEETLDSQLQTNQVTHSGLYPHFDVDVIWKWLIHALKKWSSHYHIGALAITTHGATAALIDRSQAGNGLVLPVLDYEFNPFAGADELVAEYNAVRPGFEETGSPSLPAGLNLGKQLFWQQKTFADQFGKVTDILTYPQYWAWRFTGKRCSEVTSLGCHTDLWNPYHNGFSGLVDRMRWQSLLPEMKSAGDIIGSLDTDIQAQTGLPADCQVYAGIHDSNASYYRYKATLKNQPFTVLSTGTWCIAMKNQHQTASQSLPVLDESRDMLINVDATNAPVICSRFMAGREMEVLCAELGGDITDDYTLAHIRVLVNSDCFCLPSWVSGTGPFPGLKARLQGELLDQGPVSALASLYLALMIDVQLDLVQAQGSIILEGAYVQNPHLCELLASLRPDQIIYTSRDSAGTVSGTYMLTMDNIDSASIALTQVKSVSIPGLADYKQQWRSLAG